MTDALVDNESFPRNDIDVHQIRHARHQIICLQNDLKALVKEIENGLHDVHAEAAADVGHAESTKMSDMHLDHSPINETPLCPIVRVNLVSTGSPAELAVSTICIIAESFMICVCLTCDLFNVQRESNSMTKSSNLVR